MTTNWWRLEMEAPPELQDSLLWKLDQLGIRRVALRHAPQCQERQELVAWLPEPDWPEAERQRLEEALDPLSEPFGIPSPSLRWQRQAEEDWSLSWKQHWRPDPVGDRLLVLPAWLEAPAEHAGRAVIRLDPGSAFGTGSHPTTRLCLEAIERIDPLGLRVADLGCGSGILGIGALCLGGASLAAVDTDSLAVSATGENAMLNGFALAPAGPLRLASGSVDALAALLEGSLADLLLCNILAPVIEALAPRFHTVLAPGGVGLLSGLLVEQAPELEQCLRGHGWRASLTARQGAWGLIEIRRGDAGERRTVA
jgi:ribosomal protein L11 methyltransferase